MAIKRALVVDDSRSARVSLQRMLEGHGLKVDLAGSGEDAIEFLLTELVDVVFMDHTMPGMDGLEAVTLIKANPRTATIPVMMYTTMEGEVYVGQARALGAVGVMPKNVQNHQLFDMLLSLGLVEDRRGSAAEVVDQGESGRIDTGPVSADLAAAMDDIDRQLDQQAMGALVQSMISRTLEDQHLTLRSDILRSQNSFAKEVAREVIKDHLQIAERETETAAGELRLAAPTRLRRVTGMLALALVVVSGFFAWQFKSERDDALARAQTVEASLSAQMGGELETMQREFQRLQSQLDTLRADTLDGLSWSLNEGNFVHLGENAFGARLAEKVSAFVPFLEEAGFQGEIRLSSHLGRFCMRVNSSGSYELADPASAASECEIVGHPLDDSDYVSDRLSVAFSNLLLNDPAPGIRLNLIALDGQDSSSGWDYPGAGSSAGQWNLAALFNNRVEVELLPDPR